MPQLIILVAMFALLWVLLIRPQRVRQQKQQQLLLNIEPGDEILTAGGLYGIVKEIDEEDDLIVEIAEGIQVRIARRSVGGVVKPDDDHEDDEDDDGDVPALEAADADADMDVDTTGEDEADVKDSKDLVSSEAAEGSEGSEPR